MNKEARLRQTPVIEKVENPYEIPSPYTIKQMPEPKYEPPKQQKSQKNLNKGFKLFDTKSPKNSSVQISEY